MKDNRELTDKQRVYALEGIEERINKIARAAAIESELRYHSTMNHKKFYKLLEKKDLI